MDSRSVILCRKAAKLLAMPWGIVSLVDLYVGFALFSIWIVYREKAILPIHPLGHSHDGTGFLDWCTVHLHRLANQPG